VRGDVCRLRVPKGTEGHEQRGVRYGVVVQSDDFDLLSTCLVAPTSTTARRASFRPEIEVRGKATRILVEQARAVDRSHLGEPVAHLGFGELRAVEAALRLLLAL
jgi:mRNA interferase MazF